MTNKYDIADEFNTGLVASLSHARRDERKSPHWLAGWDAGYGLKEARTAKLNAYLLSLNVEPMATVTTQRAAASPVKPHKPISHVLGNGFTAVPTDAVTLNGLYLPHISRATEPYNGSWCVIAPNGRALDGEDERPYYYRDLDHAKQDISTLGDDYSTCH